MTPSRLESLPRFEGRARSRPFVLAADRAAVVGREDAGVREVLLHPVRAVSGMRTGLLAAHRVEIATGAVRRHLETEGGSVVESVLVLPRLPGVLLRWSREDPEPGLGPLPLSLGWRSPTTRPGGAEGGSGAPGLPSEAAGEDDGVRIPLADGAGTLVFTLLGGEGRWDLERRRGDGEAQVRVRLRCDLPPNGSVAVALTLARNGGIEADAALGRFGRPDAVLNAWAEIERREEEERLRLDVDDGRLGSALAWVRRRLTASIVHPRGLRPGRVVSGYGNGCSRTGAAGRGSPAPSFDAPPEASPLEAVWTGHGLLAAGRHRDALEVAARLAARLPGPTATSDPPPPATERRVAETSLTLHFLATAALWTGDARTLHRERGAVDAALDERIAGTGSPGAGTVASAAALREMADALEAAGDPDRGSALRSRWESHRSRLASWAEGDRRVGGRRQSEEDGPRSLPVLPGPEEGAGDDRSGLRQEALLPGPAVLAAVLRVPGPPPVVRETAWPGSARGRAGLLAWARWERGDPADGLGGWRSLLLDGAGDGRGLWARDSSEAGRGDRCPWHPATTALVVAPLVFGMLGARADAAYGRLRLAPRVPVGWKRFEVAGLRVGDVRVRLAYRRKGHRHTFVLAPATGRIPLNVVFEPLLPISAVRAVRVDGEAADLEIRRHRDRTGVRLQLPLDSRRVITVDGADERGS